LQNIPAQDQIHSVTIQQLQESTNYLSTTGSDASSKKMCVLQTIFGYERFKGRQEEAIDAILSGSDCLIILPTGAGKTLCYSIPAIIAGGLTVVISPLMSLMLDQVQHLRSKGLNVAYINSSVADDDRNTIIHICCLFF
jgi:ATP-dependent DNA helicase RecQ